jgi:hypothetical protein
VKISAEDIQWLSRMQEDDGHRHTVPEFERSRLLVFGLIELEHGVYLITDKGKELLSGAMPSGARRGGYQDGRRAS